MSSEPELGLRLDTRYNRIHIHRATLKAMGNPEYVVLGIHPKGRKLVMLPSAENVPDALRVRYAEDNTFCIHSKSNIHTIIYNQWHVVFFSNFLNGNCRLIKLF